jgi:hypothetical protein
MATILLNLYIISILFYLMSLVYVVMFSPRKGPLEALNELERIIAEDPDLSEEAKDAIRNFCSRLIMDKSFLLTLVTGIGLTPVLNVALGASWVKHSYKESRDNRG